MVKYFDLLRKKVLLSVVFITGACVLILEVVATRILSPYFGNTIFNYSSVIGIVLAALSLGYYFGGKYADKHPSENVFYKIIMLSGFATIGVKLLMIFILPYLGSLLSITTGPVVASIVLFTLPCFLMGTLSPYVIKLQEIRFKKRGIGDLSGEVFFFSTLGSIFGSFLAGFYLIPAFGIGNIVLGVGIVLFTLGLFGLSASDPYKKKVIPAILGFSILLTIASIKETFNDRLIYTKDGYYEKIGVLDSEFKGKPARLLIQDRSFSSGINLNEPHKLLFDYTKYIDLYKLVDTKPDNALFIGGGAYSMPSYLIKNLPEINVDVAEVEPDLFPIAMKYFGVNSDPRLKNNIEDGRRFLHDSDKEYDIIFSDVYASVYSIPSHFTTKEFFILGRSKLSRSGIFLVNIISDLTKKKPSLLYSEMRTFKEVFPNSYFIAVDSPTHSGAQNIILVGLKSDDTLDFNKIAKEHHEDPLLKGIPGKIINITTEELSDHPVMTDDYSPTEYLTSKLFQ